jgi:hypothetical protein
MKNLYNFSIITVIFLFIGVSCSKDEVKTFEKSKILGTWVQSSGDDLVACPDGDNATIEITETKYTEYAVDDAGCSTSSGFSFEYTFDGRNIDIGMSALGINIEVVDVNTTTLKLKYSDSGGSKSRTFTKK